MGWAISLLFELKPDRWKLIRWNARENETPQANALVYDMGRLLVAIGVAFGMPAYARNDENELSGYLVSSAANPNRILLTSARFKYLFPASCLVFRHC